MPKLTELQILIAKRRKARHYAMQALYQWKMTGTALNKIDAEFRTDNDFKKVDIDYFADILHQVPATLDEIDPRIKQYLTDRTLDDVNPVELSILRMAIFELNSRIDTPYKVVINEAVALAKKFGAEESHKFINAILDKVAAELRTIEVNANTAS